MSVKHSLLALLTQGPRYGYHLRAEFEERTGSTWPLNIGQVYTTLDRLERDGLVEDQGDDGAGHRFYAITEAGRAEADDWFSQPSRPSNPPRSELAIKLALAVTTPGVNVERVIQAQRSATLRSLQDFTRAKRSTGGDLGPADLAGLLVLESLIFTAEAEIRWLDHCEAAVLRAARSGHLPAVPAAPPAPASVPTSSRITVPTPSGASRHPASSQPSRTHSSDQQKDR
ncbi:PadR family transcriptional regulator [Citricoccus nitrophenolicus]|uniref:DNA-binding PadR family transcriptional regulator n=1 Tax=Citricoccus muralis TaxID=169134 RepID=A0A3D9LCK4_9MICC|nr:PadR family transcriptional regulator [Citricoccus muralis]REE03975.1 DNA-binding PadR family transcriptional regulator [Citricoccus muralis]